MPWHLMSTCARSSVSSRLLKKPASIVLTSLKGSTYGTKYDFASSLAAALLDGHFEQPAGFAGAVHDFFSPMFFRARMVSSPC
jgi:hypothetical protein